MFDKDYEEMIDSLSLQNKELQNKVNILYKLCKKLEDYINEHNLFDLKVEIANSNGKQIAKLEEFERIVYLKIPKAVYVISNEGDEK